MAATATVIVEQKVSVKPRVLIVGAGPVGLLTAYMLLSTSYPVSIAEKRAFTRKQILQLDKQFWNILPREVKKRLITNGACQYIGSSPSCARSAAETKEMIVSDDVIVHIVLGALQTYMMEYLMSTFGSLFRLIAETVSLDKISTTFRGQIVIVADGSGPSSLGSDLWYATTGYSKPASAATTTTTTTASSGSGGDQSPYNTIRLGSAVVYTFEDPSASKVEETKGYTYVSGGQRAIGMLRAMPDYFYLGAQIRDATLAAMTAIPEADRFNWFHGTTLEGRYIRHVFSKLFSSEAKGRKNLKFTAFPLEIKAAKQFYYEYRDKIYFLIGDAAFTTHFFTGQGMNSGLRASLFLVQLLQHAPPSTWSAAYNIQMYRLMLSAWRLIPEVTFDADAVYSSCASSTAAAAADEFDRCVMERSGAIGRSPSNKSTALLIKSLLAST
jgi:flavin-dependent dehydrogenase